MIEKKMKNFSIFALILILIQFNLCNTIALKIKNVTLFEPKRREQNTFREIRQNSSKIVLLLIK